MGNPIDGRRLAEKIRADLSPRIARLPRRPGLGVLLAGHDPSSILYVRLKQRAAESLGMKFSLERMAPTATTEELLERLSRWNENPELDGLIVQLPLPRQIDGRSVMTHLAAAKDADGFHPVNSARYLAGSRPTPPVLVDVILRILDSMALPAGLQSAAIVARPSVFTDCLTAALTRRQLRVCQTDPDGRHRGATELADLVVVAAGQPNLIVAEDLKRDAIVIDIGINTRPDGTITGDLSPQAQQAAGWYTPVPGGVGPMTIAVLLEHVVRLSEQNQQ